MEGQVSTAHWPACFLLAATKLWRGNLLAVRHTTRSWRGIQIVIYVVVLWQRTGIDIQKAFHHICCDCNHVGIIMVVILYLVSSYPGRLWNSHGGWSVSQYSCSFGFIGHHISTVIGWWGNCTTLKWETRRHACTRRRTTTAQIYHLYTPIKYINQIDWQLYCSP